MTTYSVEIKKSAAREIRALAKADRERVVDAIDGLAEAPLQGSALKGNLKGLRRIRVGSSRIICEVQDRHLVVLVLHVGDRKHIYR